MIKKVIITGQLGQDATILASLLLEQGHKVYGTIRPSTSSNFWRLEEEGILNHSNLEIVQCDISDSGAVFDLINKVKPDWFVNLAALSSVGDSFNNPIIVSTINGLGPLYCLEAIRQCSPNTRFYQASTSEMVANQKNLNGLADHNTNMIPESPYASAKLFAHNTVRIYRDSYNIFAVSSILYNHSSKYRGEYFVERKICKYVAQVKLGINSKHLLLGNLNASRDIGHSKEYMRGVIQMLSHHTPTDYTLCTGKTYTIKDILSRAFSYINKDWEEYVVTDDKLLRPLEVHVLHGDHSKAKDLLGWKPILTLDDILEEIIEADINRLQTKVSNETSEWSNTMKLMAN